MLVTYNPHWARYELRLRFLCRFFWRKPGARVQPSECELWVRLRGARRSSVWVTGCARGTVSMEVLAMLLCSALAMVQGSAAPEGTTTIPEGIAETTTPQWSGWIYRAFTEGMIQFSITSPDPKCSRDGLLYRQNLQNLTLWATRSMYFKLHIS